MQAQSPQWRLREIFGAMGIGPVGARIAKTFALMDIAAEEVAAARLDEVAGALEVLCPTGSMLNLSPDVYRSHVRELCGRIVEGEKLAPATHAEAMMVMAETSLWAPLNSPAAFVYETLFVRVLPRQAIELGLVERDGIFPRQVEEDIDSIRKNRKQLWRDAVMERSAALEADELGAARGL